MRCRYCQQDIKPGSELCEWCGRRQEAETPPAGPGTSPPASPAIFAESPSDFTWKAHWASIRQALKEDPLLMLVFLLVGFNALSAFAHFMGLTSRPGPLAYIADIFALAAFAGLIAWRYWAWVLVVASQALGILLNLMALRFAAGHPRAVLWVVFHLGVGIFILAVLAPRKDDFE
jgi:hypothetical protein